MTVTSGTPALIIGAALAMTSCSVTHHGFGQTLIGNTTDTVLSAQAIVKIRSLDNGVFDVASYTSAGEVELKYRLFKPAQNTGKLYPLVVVYHGSGAIGNDNRSQLGVLPKLFAGDEIQKIYPAFVLAPQFPARSSNYVLDSSRNVLASVGQPCLNTVLQLIDSLKEHLPIR